MKTLLIEDDFAHAALILRALGNVLDTEDVSHVDDGAEALDLIYHRGKYGDPDAYPRPDLILLDLRLPGMDGMDVLRTLKSDDSTRNIPIVILSTSDRPRDVDECYARGANAFVTKPLAYRDFSNKIAQLGAFWKSIAQVPTSPAKA